MYLKDASSSENTAFRQQRRTLEFCRRKFLGFDTANKMEPFYINITSKTTSATQAKAL